VVSSFSSMDAIIQGSDLSIFCLRYFLSIYLGSQLLKSFLFATGFVYIHDSLLIGALNLARLL